MHKLIGKLNDSASGFFFEFYEQWTQFLSPQNWYTFDFCHIQFENDKAMGAVEATVVILGLGFRWRWNHTMTERRKMIDERMASVKDGGAKTVALTQFMAEMEAKGFTVRTLEDAMNDDEKDDAAR